MPEAGGQAAAFSHNDVLRILSGVLVCMLMAALDQTVLATALPAIAADFHGVPYLSWCITSYLLASTAATLIFGKLSDLWGRRILLEASIGVFLVASVACALSQNMAELIAARAVQGIGGGGLYSMAQASIADVVSARERGRYQAYITSAFSTAAIIGPVIGGFSVEYLTWRWAFWINLPLGIVAYFLCHRGLARVIVHRVRRPVDYLGAALMLPGVSALILCFTLGGSTLAWTSPRLLGLALAAIVFLLAFIARERRAPEALLPPRLFASPVFCVASALNFFINAITVGTFMLLPVFLQFAVGVTPDISGAMLIVPFAAQITSSILTGRRVQRTGRYVPSPRLGFLLLLVAAILFTTMTASTPLWLIELYMMVNGIGNGLCQAPLWVAIQNSAELKDLGAVTGANAFFRALGGAFGASILWSLLLTTLDRTVSAEGHAGYGSTLLRDGRAALTLLPADVRAVLIPALSHSFGYAFAAAGVISAAAFATTYFLKEIPLRTTTRQAKPDVAAAD
ncbi:MAG TPA: MDR family MFS transporter [Stellaceae bacterium]|nr:MDR family MFS transporter [Stellaceae bacterium]